MRTRLEPPVALSRIAGALPGPQLAPPAAAEDDEGGGGISMTQLLLILKAYWRIATVIAVAVIAVGAVIIKILPKSYTATATLKVDSEVRDPLAGQVNTLAEQRGGYIPTEMQMMVSSDVLLPVVDKLKLTQMKEYVAGFRGIPSPENLRQFVKDRLTKDLDIEQGSQGSLLINITATASNAILAADIANAVADSYLLEERARVDNPANERAKRYTEQIAELKAKVTAAAEQVAAFKQRTGITDPTGTKNTEADTLTTMQTRLEDARNARREAEVKAAGDPMAGKNGHEARDKIEGLKSQLATETAQMAQLSTTLGPNHPRIRELQSQMDVTRHTIDQEMHSYSHVADADLIAARELEQKLQQAVEQQKAKVLAASNLRDEGNKYMLELDSAQTVYRRALDGYDQIVFASAGHYSYVDLVSRAEPASKSTKPNKVKLLALNILAALGLGLAIPMGYELFLNRRIRCSDDLERAFRVPVLAEFDAMPRDVRLA